jgi:hypothetical protein
MRRCQSETGWPSSFTITTRTLAQDETSAVNRGSTPSPITRPPPTAQRRGKGGPKAHPRGTRKRPSGSRRRRRHSRGMGAGAASRSGVRRVCGPRRSPHTVRRWSAKRPETANIARRRPTVKVLLRTDSQSQPTPPNHPSGDFARRGLGVRFPSSPPSPPAAASESPAGRTTADPRSLIRRHGPAGGRVDRAPPIGGRVEP